MRFKRDQRGISNVIVFVLGLVIVVVIVSNVFLWNYEMNQLDWEKMQEDIEITDVTRVTSSSWSTAESEYTVNTGTHVNGTYSYTKTSDEGLRETFREGQPETLPCIIGTSSRQSATRYPFQRKAFYAEDLFWAFYSDGSDLVFRTSTDGSNWSSSTIVRESRDGFYFSTWFDGTYVHYACGRGSSGEALYYRQGTPHANGTITWSTAQEQVVSEAVSTVSYYRRSVWAEGNLWVMNNSYSGVSDYTTEIVTGNASAGNYYYINPFNNHTTPNGTTLPTDILSQGWRTSTPISLEESGYRVRGYLRNRDSSSHSGRIYARLWKSPYANMSNAVSSSDWKYRSVSFSATRGEERSFSINFEVTDPPNNEYLYVEFTWYISAASSSQTAGLFLRAETSNSYVRQYGWSYYYPYVSVDSNGYPFVGYRRDSYYDYPFVSMSCLNNGTWETASGFPYKLQTSSSSRWRAAILPLTNGKTYSIYNNRGTTYGRLWNGSSWEIEETVTTTDLRQPEYLSAVSNGDNVHFVFLSRTTLDINYLERINGTGWGSETTIQASTTSTSAPVLSVYSSSNDLYCFWAGSPTTNWVYYKKRVNGTWDSTPETWIEEQSSLTENDRLTSYFEDTAGRIGVIFMANTANPYELKHEYLSLTEPLWSLDLNGTFTIDTTSNPLDTIQGLEIKLRYKVSDTTESWHLEAYNWTSHEFSNNGFNPTNHTPTAGWNYYSVNITAQWRSYVKEDGKVYVKLHDQGRDNNQTIVDIDFLGVRTIIDGTRFTFKNAGSLTTRLVSLWIINSTNHRRYDLDLSMNSAQTLTYTRADITLPTGQHIVKVTTERGNIAARAGS